MTWTYSGNPGSSTRDEVRFLIQDTDTNSQLLSNEELDYLITSYGEAYSAAVAAVGVLIATASRAVQESKTVGDLSISKSEGARLQQWQALMVSLQNERFRRFPAAPVVNANVLLPTDERDEENEGSDFVVGQMDNKT